MNLGPPPLWLVYADMLVMFGIVRLCSIQAQPLCLAAYRPARAVQPFDKLRHRMCGPQGDEFAKLLVGPTGHCGLGHGGPQRHVPCLQNSRRDFRDRIFSTWNNFAVPFKWRTGSPNNQHITDAGGGHVAEGDFERVGGHGSAPYQRTLCVWTIVAHPDSAFRGPNGVPGSTRSPRATSAHGPVTHSSRIGAVCCSTRTSGAGQKLGSTAPPSSEGARRGECRAGPRISAKHGPAGTSRRSGVGSGAQAVLPMGRTSQPQCGRRRNFLMISRSWSAYCWMIRRASSERDRLGGGSQATGGARQRRHRHPIGVPPSPNHGLPAISPISRRVAIPALS